MKTGIHPQYMTTKVTCSGCGTTFESMSTVPEIAVEICSNCHPFYTGKQKLVDTAGRVDRFRAQSEAAKALLATKSTKKARPKVQKTADVTAELKKLKQEIATETVDVKSETKSETKPAAEAKIDK